MQRIHGAESTQDKIAAAPTLLPLLRDRPLTLGTAPLFVGNGRTVANGYMRGWRASFLSAGEAALTTNPLAGDELERERVRASLDAALVERSLLNEKIARPQRTANSSRPPDSGIGP